MKNFNFVLLCVALVGCPAIEAAQLQKKPYRKPAVKAASRPAKPGPAAKPIIKTDKELLREQIAVLSGDWVLAHSRAMKDFFYKNLCPIRNWTKQDQIDTAIWVRKAYAILKKGPDKKNVQMPTPADFFETILYKLFKVSPFYINATGTQKEILENDLTLWLRVFIQHNMTTDLKNIKPFPLDRWF